MGNALPLSWRVESPPWPRVMRKRLDENVRVFSPPWRICPGITVLPLAFSRQTRIAAVGWICSLTFWRRMRARRAAAAAAAFFLASARFWAALWVVVVGVGLLLFSPPEAPR